MNRWAPVAAAAALALGWLAVVQAEEVTLTTYYPSPRGAYDQLLVNRMSSLRERDRYFFDLDQGVVRTRDLVLYDPVADKAYTVRMEHNKLMISDPALAKPVMILELPHAHE